MNPYIVIKPVITEKSVELANKENIYTFLVDRNSNKNQISEAIGELYKVKVIDVNTVARQADTKKTGKKRQSVKVPRSKKALVKLEKGQIIELFDVSK